MTGHAAFALDRGFSLVPATHVYEVRDEEHAQTLLREAGCRAEGDELRQLAVQVAAGTLILARADEHERLDALDQIGSAPLLSLMVVG